LAFARSKEKRTDLAYRRLKVHLAAFGVPWDGTKEEMLNGLYAIRTVARKAGCTTEEIAALLSMLLKGDHCEQD